MNWLATEGSCNILYICVDIFCALLGSDKVCEWPCSVLLSMEEDWETWHVCCTYKTRKKAIHTSPWNHVSAFIILLMFC